MSVVTFSSTENYMHPLDVGYYSSSVAKKEIKSDQADSNAMLLLKSVMVGMVDWFFFIFIDTKLQKTQMAICVRDYLCDCKDSFFACISILRCSNSQKLFSY